MPIYQYKCEKCEQFVDIDKLMADSGRKEYHCGKPMRRVLTSPKLTFGALSRRTDIELKSTDMEEGVEIFKKRAKEKRQRQSKEAFKKMVDASRINL